MSQIALPGRSPFRVPWTWIIVIAAILLIGGGGYLLSPRLLPMTSQQKLARAVQLENRAFEQGKFSPEADRLRQEVGNSLVADTKQTASATRLDFALGTYRKANPDATDGGSVAANFFILAANCDVTSAMRISGNPQSLRLKVAADDMCANPENLLYITANGVKIERLEKQDPRDPSRSYVADVSKPLDAGDYITWVGGVPVHLVLTEKTWRIKEIR